MLLELRVKDFGIIEDIDWKLDEGLNVITGETGAGKSLVVDAVGLLLSGAPGDDVIRSGASEALIEGVFSLPDNQRYSSLKNFLSEKGLNEGSLIIGYEIRKQKPVIVRINGHTVTKTLLRQVGQHLIDIHGQSEHLSLLVNKYHLDFLDAYGHTTDIRKQFTDKVYHLNELELELKSLKEKEQHNFRQQEFLKYQIDEIDKASLRIGEDEELEQERRIISLSEKLKEYSHKIYRNLFGGDGSNYTASVMVKLNEALQDMKKLAELDPKLNQHLDYLDKTVYGIEEIARDIKSYGDNLENDPKRMEEIESRLDLIHKLKRKYGRSVDEILNYLERSEKELIEISLSTEKQQQLNGERTGLKQEMGQLASELSRERFLAARGLEKDVMKELGELDMAQMQFEVRMLQTQSAEGIEAQDGKTYLFNSEGIDEIEFMVSTNPGEPLKPLAKIASTGEISRFTLALKTALSEADKIPVLIFDEIDIGVGGRSGDIIGKKLWALARNHQVVCVTHLPQIAVYADSHYCVNKEVIGQHTSSTLINLSNGSRINEVALMLAGPGYSETVLKNAGELMQKADNWKNLQSHPTQLKF